jgi:beta-N-acetylhexosaminidase
MVIAFLGLTAIAAVAFILIRDTDDAPNVPEAGVGVQAERRISFLARLIPPAPERSRVPSSPRVPRSVTELARRLPLERKVAQMFLLGFSGKDLNGPFFQQLRRLDFGGMVIAGQNYTDPQGLGLLAGEGVAIAQQERHVPPWVMAAQEGGAFNEFPDLPPATTASRLRDTDQAAAEAREAGRTLKALGISGLLAPALDVGLAEEAGANAATFSDEPESVAAYGRAVVGAYRRARVFTAAKHFPGLGSASQSTEEGPANVGLSLGELERRDLIPFRAAIRAGVPGIVLSHGLYSIGDFVTPGSLQREIVTGLLRRRLRFKGIAITDDLADPAITTLGSVPDAAVSAVKAGADMLHISGSAGDQQAAYVAVLRAVRRKEVSRRRINQAVIRILSVKRDYGLIRR